LHCLKFHNKPAIYQEIETMFSDLLGFIGNLYRFLTLMRNSKVCKLNTESLLIK